MTFAHPQLPKDICALLGIAGLEDAVFEVLDQSEPLEFTDSLQVSKAHAHLKLRDRSNSSTERVSLVQAASSTTATGWWLRCAFQGFSIRRDNSASAIDISLPPGADDSA